MTKNHLSVNPLLTFDPNEAQNLTANALPNSINVAVTPTLQFSRSTFSVREDGTLIRQVVVTRTGENANNLSATIQLTNGSAIAPGDYNNAPITVNFTRGGNGLSFDGVDDYVSLPAVTSSGAMTVEAWVNADDVNRNYSRIFDFGNGPNSNNVILFYDSTSGRMTLSNFQGSSGRFLSTSEVFPENQWVHVAAVIDATGNASIYWDGQLKASGNVAPVLNVNRTNRYIGRSNWSGDAYFDGKIDDVRIWNRARTQAEIQANLSRQLTGTESGLVDYYNFNTNSGNSAIDSTATQRNGTIVGATRTSGFLPTSIAVNIPVVNDTLVEDNETVSLTLTNPTGGAVLGTQNTATLTIIDNDGVNLITNGSFENGPDPGLYIALNPGSTAITGWTVTRGQIDYKGTYFIDDADGTRSLDLNGSPGVGGIAQTFNTVAGQRYRVNFAMAGNTYSGTPIKTMAVSAAGQSANFTFDTTGYSTSNMGWEDKTWTFTANSSTTTLEFYSLSNEPASSNDGPALDNVSVVALAGANVTLGLNYSGISENSPENFIYTFTRTGSLTNPLTVNFSVSGTATLNTDYIRTGGTTFTATNGTVTFAAGSATATITLNPTEDTTVEPNDTVSLTLTAAAGYTVGTTTPVTATIINDDQTRSQISTNGNDVIVGTSRPDVITGGTGNDLLTGGAEGDLFNYLATNEGIDRITDFTPNEDFISVRGSSFGGGLTAGYTISPQQFVIGTAATNSSHRFIYNSATGGLLFDVDGSGATAAIQLATLNTGLSLTSQDILVN